MCSSSLVITTLFFTPNPSDIIDWKSLRYSFSLISRVKMKSACSSSARRTANPSECWISLSRGSARCTRLQATLYFSPSWLVLYILFRLAILLTHRTRCELPLTLPQVTKWRLALNGLDKTLLQISPFLTPQPAYGNGLILFPLTRSSCLPCRLHVWFG